MLRERVSGAARKTNLEVRGKIVLQAFAVSHRCAMKGQTLSSFAAVTFWGAQAKKLRKDSAARRRRPSLEAPMFCDHRWDDSPGHAATDPAELVKQIEALQKAIRDQDTQINQMRPALEALQKEYDAANEAAKEYDADTGVELSLAPTVAKSPAKKKRKKSGSAFLKYANDATLKEPSHDFHTVRRARVRRRPISCFARSRALWDARKPPPPPSSTRARAVARALRRARATTRTRSRSSCSAPRGRARAHAPFSCCARPSLPLAVLHGAGDGGRHNPLVLLLELRLGLSRRRPAAHNVHRGRAPESARNL